MNRQGQRCRRQPIVGGSVCVLHGASPQVREAAKRRLLEASEPAITRLLAFIESPPGLCPTCNRSDDVSAIVGAIRTVLDRCGLGPQATVTVEPEPVEDVSSLTDDELIARFEVELQRMYAARDRRRALTVEGEVLLPEADQPVPALIPVGNSAATNGTEEE